MAKKSRSVGIGAVKGGVGKTLITLNVAKQLSKDATVALLDADLDNSSFAQFTSANARIGLTEDHRFKPYKWDGIDVFSMSLIASRTQSVSMQSSRYAQILHDVITRTEWNPEFFLVDLPGGSSDVFRTIMEILAENLVGNVIICQPLMKDATEKFIHLHRYLEIPVLGLIENMSYFQPHRKKYHPFGESTVDDIAEEYGVPVLGKIPLSAEIAESVSSGKPFFPDGITELLQPVCNKIRSSKIPPTSGLLTRVAEKIGKALKDQVEKVMIHFILSSNKAFDIGALRTDMGFRDKKPFLFLITDESKTKEITRVALRVAEDKIKVLSNPDELDYGIETDFKTLARMIMRQRKLVNNQLVDYSAWDAWCHGDIKGFGLGYAPRAVRVIREVFENEQVMNTLQARMGGVLKRWI